MVSVERRGKQSRGYGRGNRCCASIGDRLICQGQKDVVKRRSPQRDVRQLNVGGIQPRQGPGERVRGGGRGHGYSVRSRCQRRPVLLRQQGTQRIRHRGQIL